MSHGSTDQDRQGGAVTKGQNDVNDMTGVNKETADKLLGAARTGAKGIEAIKAEMQAFGIRQFKDGIAALDAVKAAKNVTEAMDLQFKFARNFFDAYLQETSRLCGMTFDLLQQNLKQGQEAFAPMEAQVEATVGKFADHIAA
jgi:hypothetical protein